MLPSRRVLGQCAQSSGFHPRTEKKKKEIIFFTYVVKGVPREKK
jgi:hypothetical protein